MSIYIFDYASHWILVGFTIDTGNKGLEIDTASNFLVDSITVSNIEAQCVYLKNSASFNTIQNSLISGCGTGTSTNGKGVSLRAFLI